MREDRKARWLNALWPLAAGGLAAGGQAPVSLWPLPLIGFALLFAALLRAPSPKSAARLGWCFGVGYFGAALSWIVEPFLVDIARHGWMAPFALILMAAGLALFWGLALGTAKWAAPVGRWRPALAFAATLTLAEALRGVIFTGFPWALIGHGLISSPALPLAAIGGAHALSLALLLPAASLGMVIASLTGATRRGALVPGLTGAVLLAAMLLLPARFVALALPAGPDAPIIRLVQPNAAQRDKWDPEKSVMYFNRLLDYSGAPGNGPDGPARPDLVVWPETAVPYLLDTNPSLPQVLSEASLGVPLAVGLQHSDPRRRYFNSLAVIGSDARIADIYDKHHLVPFGEYLPFDTLLGRFGLGALAAQFGGGYTPGPGPQVLDIPGVGAALPLICYEAVFPEDIRDAPRRPDFLLQITNDGWFGTFSGPYQHLAQARLRAAEQGLPMIRVANTGVSALIAADGKVLDSLPLGVDGYLDVVLPPPLATTPYARFGDLPALLLAFVAFIFAIRARLTRHTPASHKAIDHIGGQS
ncbi:apolipoprotein N-acyltransferase [Pseudooceanicola algae]|uniref:Apolipoprotein N-acyltransferase n=1 Tax=Pseudooceanicola algae TaxID=1537215 RepID=A0A418SJI2_9RHOB|nr:apolipoprotein N-acyltransferase [Pseudooceanicola algae]QPM91890.1 Apolipoprotein N-acyltransferase [Pseudooceanicola algae]